MFQYGVKRAALTNDLLLVRSVSLSSVKIFFPFANTKGKKERITVYYSDEQNSDLSSYLCFLKH